MRSIDNDIQNGNYRHLYLLFGSEHYLIRGYRDKLLKGLGVTKEEGDMNFTWIRNRSFSVADLMEQVDTMPFFADVRVILVENSGFFKGSSKANEELAEYFKQIPETSILMFAEQDVDKRGKLYKAATKAGCVEEMNMPTEKELMSWIGGRLKEAGIGMKTAAWREFYRRCQNSMDLMDQESQKLIAYCLNKGNVELEDVEAVCVNSAESKVFDLIDAMAGRDAKRAMKVYQDMLLLDEAPMAILALIVRQFRQLHSLMEMEQQRLRPEREKELLNQKSDYVLRKLKGYLRNFKKTEIEEVLTMAAENEAAFKSGRLEERMSVELLLLSFIH
jgi:DNA polymerase-3 subunit delta